MALRVSEAPTPAQPPCEADVTCQDAAHAASPAVNNTSRACPKLSAREEEKKAPDPHVRDSCSRSLSLICLCSQSPSFCLSHQFHGGSSHGITFGADLGEKSVGPEGTPFQTMLYPIAIGPIRHQTMGRTLPVWAKSVRPDPSVGHSGSVVGPVCLERPVSLFAATRSNQARALRPGALPLCLLPNG